MKISQRTRKMLVPTGITLKHRPIVITIVPNGWIVLREYRRRGDTAVRIHAEELYTRLVREALGIRPA